MITPGRNWTSGSEYRYGFNGYENLIEIYNSYIAVDFGARVYDSRLGKFYSIDPRSIEYPWQSPFAYYSNSPISIVDIDGNGGVEPDKDGSHELQSLSDGVGNTVLRTYTQTLNNSGVSAEFLFETVSNDFAYFTNGVSYFEKTKGDLGCLQVGDEFSIVGGLTYSTYDLDDYAPGAEVYAGFSKEGLQKNFPDQVDENNVFHRGEIRTGVTVTNVSKDEINNKYSFTFQTWKGHVEAGSITFIFVQEQADVQVAIKSATKSANGISKYFYYNQGGRAEQTQHWNTFQSNIAQLADAENATQTNTYKEGE